MGLLVKVLVPDRSSIEREKAEAHEILTKVTGVWKRLDGYLVHCLRIIA